MLFSSEKSATELQLDHIFASKFLYSALIWTYNRRELFSDLSFGEFNKSKKKSVFPTNLVVFE